MSTKEMKTLIIIATIIVVAVSVFAINSEATRPDHLPHGVSVFEVNGHEYISLAGSGLTHSESCTNHGGK
jgi:hypothetical protein